MKKLLALIEEQLREVNTVVTCQICYKKQLFEWDDLSRIRIGNKESYTGTGGMPRVQCEHCKAKGNTTLISLNEHFYYAIQSVVLKAIIRQPAKYVDGPYEDG